MKEKNKDSTIQSIAKYSSSHIFGQFLSLFTAFIKAKLLTLELYGLWNLLILFWEYATFAHLGSRGLMRYLIPYHEGKKEHKKSANIEGSVFYGTLWINILIVAVLIIISFFMDMTLEAKIGLVTIALMIILDWYRGHYIALLKSYQKFNLLTSSNYLKTTITFLSSITLIYLFGIYGLYLAVTLPLVAVILYLRRKHPLDTHTKFNFILFSDLIKNGFPLMVFGFIILLISTTDRIIVTSFLGTKQMGYYAISVMVLNAYMNIPGAAREIIEPKLMQSLSRESKEKILIEYFFKPLLNTAYFMPFLIGPIFFIFPILVFTALPRYIPGILPTQIIVIGGYFLALSYPVRGIIVAYKWHVKASLAIAIVLPVNIILSIILLKLGLGINGVAIGSSISFFLVFMNLLILVKRKCCIDSQTWKTNTIGLCWPLPFMCFTIIILQNVTRTININIYLAAFIKLSVFYVIMYFFVNYFSKIYMLKKIELQKKI